tara:strand:+ start:193 stop:1149 length:957 start_codon:yes stop_codon:yes gene_type:complete
LQDNQFGIERYVKGFCKVPDSEDVNKDDITFSYALEIYLKLKGNDKPLTFKSSAERAVRYLMAVSSDKSLASYKRCDATSLRDNLFKRGLAGSSVVRIFNTIKAIFNFVCIEMDIETPNPFIGLYMDRGRGVTVRKPIPIANIRLIQSECKKVVDDLRMIVALVSDTGMRLSEAVGLALDDLKIKNEEIPYIMVQNHPWRRLKTKGSERKIPLVGASLWAAKLLQRSSSKVAFPRYVKDGNCYTNSASAALNKWLRPRVPMNCSMHSFRHSMRDRLRAVGCPTEVIDQIGGWSTLSMGQKYGEGFSVSDLADWLKKIV